VGGALLLIGGHENKDDEPSILRALVKRIGSGTLVVTTVASEVPDDLWATYVEAFRKLGLERVVHLPIGSREEARSEERARLLDGAAGVLFTGGDQLRITSRIGSTQIYQRIAEIFRDGGVIAGTSAGASAMSEMMLVRGEGKRSYRIGADLLMAPGLGLLKDVIVDQHFAERGRIGRLLGAVAQNPRLLGLGLDENTAIVVEQAKRFQVVGEGAAYVVDGRGVTSTNITEEQQDRTLSIFNVRLHLLSQGDEFDLQTREPVSGSAEGVEKELAASS
jgi:cyanophycinase